MSADRARVLIVGGGVAALEALLALRALAGRLADLEMLAPERYFVYRPASVAEPFDEGEPRRFDLARIAVDQGSRLHRDRLALVDPDRRRVTTASKQEIPYDLLVVAAGAVPIEAVPGAVTFRGPGDVGAVRRTLGELERGEANRLAFALPAGASWPLPLYEMALMTATYLDACGCAGVRLTVVTPEEEPLDLFGAPASAAMRDLLDQRGVSLRTQSRPQRVEDGALLLAGGGRLEADRVIALPGLEGPRISGLPCDDAGFIPTDGHGAVRGLSDVYAAGDATTSPIKQGGAAAQQADAAAEAVAARLGAAIEPTPFRPVLRGLLLGGDGPLYLRAEPDAGPHEGGIVVASGEQGRSAASRSALWWPPSKIAGRYLAPYLATARPHPLGSELLSDRPAPAHETNDDGDRREALELTLLLADGDARSGDYKLALRSLDAAEALTGVLPPEYAAKRREWSEELDARRQAPPPR